MTARSRGPRRLPALIALLVVTVALLAAATPAAAAEPEVKLSIKPVGMNSSYIQVTARPGETLQLTAELGNFGTAPIAAKTFAADAYTIPNGGFGVRLDGEPQTGTTLWTAYPTETLTLQPGESVTRTFPLTIPVSAAPGDYLTSLIIQNANAIPGSGGVAINRVVRQAMAISIDVPGERMPALAIGGARHTASGASSVMIFDIANTGNANLKPTGEFVLVDATGAEVDRRQVTMDSVYAGTSTTLEFPFDRPLPAGDYVVSLNLTDTTTGATARLGQALISVPVIEAPVIETPAAVNTDSAAPQTVLTNAPSVVALNTPSLLLLLAVVAGSLALGVGLTFGVVRLRGGRRGAPTPPAPAPDSPEPAVQLTAVPAPSRIAAPKAGPAPPQPPAMPAIVGQHGPVLKRLK